MLSGSMSPMTMPRVKKIAAHTTLHVTPNPRAPLHFLRNTRIRLLTFTHALLFFRTSAIRAFTSFFTSADDGGLVKGNRMVPVDIS
jgi:hypothetical protein